jgi:hypothetical protein
MKKYEAIAKGFEAFGRDGRFIIYSMEHRRALFSGCGEECFSFGIKDDQIDCYAVWVNLAFNHGLGLDGCGGCCV